MERKSLPQILPYHPRFNEAFRRLNLEWIEKYFIVEKKDLDQLNSPLECLTSGGQIFFALFEENVIGTCALYKVGAQKYELAKMAVHEDYRGLGIGDLLITHSEQWAKEHLANEIAILSNTILEPALCLYQKHGYLITHLGPHPDYQRCNVELRKTFPILLVESPKASKLEHHLHG